MTSPPFCPQVVNIVWQLNICEVKLCSRLLTESKHLNLGNVWGLQTGMVIFRSPACMHQHQVLNSRSKKQCVRRRRREKRALDYYAYLDILRAAALAAEKRKLPRLHSASASVFVRPSVIGFHRRRRRRGHELVRFSPPLQSDRASNPLSKFIAFCLVKIPLITTSSKPG